MRKATPITAIASFIAIALSTFLLIRGEAFADVDLSQLYASTVYLQIQAEEIPGGEIKKYPASGVVITHEGQVLTVAHVLLDLVDPTRFKNVKIYGVVGNKYGFPVPLQRTGLENLKADIAILQFPQTMTPVPGLAFKPARIASEDEHVNAPITIAGFPLGMDLTVLGGNIVAKTGPNGTWVTDAKVQPGSSGSPVFDAFGQLVGIVKGGAKDVISGQPLGLNLIIPISIARSIGSGLNWSVGTAQTKTDCKGAQIRLTGDKIALPDAVSRALDRDMPANALTGVLATKYPWVVLDGGTLRLPPSDVNVLRFCRLDLKNGSKIIVGNGQLRILANFISSEGGSIVGVDPSATPRTPVSRPVPGQPGAPGSPGASSGSVIIAPLVRLDGVLAVNLDGGRGGDGGAGGPGVPGAPGAAGQGGSDSLVGCKRGPGDGEQGRPGGQGAAGGAGGQGGDAGSLQFINSARATVPAKAIKFSAKGGIGGAGGLGGIGGPGGRGGPRGAQTTFCKGGHDGPQGPAGANGQMGPSGAEGADGNLDVYSRPEKEILNLF